MSEWLVGLVVNLPIPWRVFLLSMIPVTELRVAIPLGIAWGLDPVTNYVYAVMGNIFPVLPILFFLEPVFVLLSRNKYLKKLIDKLLVMAEEKKAYYERYALFGLTFFVSIPAPGTGAWTGSLIAFVLRVHRLKAFMAVSLGVLIVGLIMTLLSIGAFSLSSRMVYYMVAVIVIVFVATFIRKIKKQ